MQLLIRIWIDTYKTVSITLKYNIEFIRNIIIFNCHTAIQVVFNYNNKMFLFFLSYAPMCLFFLDFEGTMNLAFYLYITLYIPYLKVVHEHLRIISQTI